MATFIEAADLPFANQMNNFCGKVNNYATLLGLDTAKITALQKSNTLVQLVMVQQEVAQQYGVTFTAYKDLLRYGNGTQILGNLPAPPVYPTPTPAITNANVQADFAELIQDCVKSKNFTTDIGNDLGILKPVTPFDPQAGQPKLTVKTAQGGHPLLHSKIGEYEAFQIWKDSGDGKGFVLLGTSQHPDYLDLTALPAIGITATWKYKAIYLYDNQQAGNWSTVVIVTVVGNV